MKKKIAVLLGSMIVIGAAGVGAKIYGDSQKHEVADVYYFDVSSKEYVRNMTTYSEESCEVGDYVVTLENSLYDDVVDIGCCTFSIKGKDREMSEEELNDFFKQYEIVKYFTGGGGGKAEYENGVLYCYRDFEITGEAPDMRNKIVLSDREGNTVHEFTLISKDDHKEYVWENETCIISPLGLRICRNQPIERDAGFILKYDNGKEDKRIPWGDYHFGSHTGEYKIAVMKRFDKIMDIDDIRSIVINGNEYQVKN